MSEIDPKLVDRMVALLRRMNDAADSVEQTVGLMYGIPVVEFKKWHSEAKAIVTELSAPIDPDLIMARDFAMDLAHAQQHIGGGCLSSILNGEFDNAPLWGVPIFLKAIKRVRSETNNG